MKRKSRLGTATIWSHQLPTSSDPIDYDVAVHHYAFGPVFIKLFSTYRDSIVSGELATEWEHNADFTKWRISIRSDVKFSNGKNILPIDVLRSLKRIIFLSKMNHSSNPLVNSFVEIEKLRSLEDEFSGLTVAGQSIHFSFRKPVENLVEQLAFGLYAIVSSGDFDAHTGKWTAKIPTSSGPYLVETFDERGFSLRLRKDFPKELRHDSAINEFVFTSDPSLRNSADIVDGFKEDLPGDGLQFWGASTTDILYMHVFTWRSGPFSNVQVRIALREAFYSKLEQLGVRPTRSFFPLVMPGVEEIFYKGSSELKLSGKEVKFKPPSNTTAVRFQKINEALKSVVVEHGGKLSSIQGVRVDQLRRHIRGDLSDNLDIDLGTRLTSMGSEDPRTTFAFMLSKEGIFLPDPNEQLAQLTKRQDFSFQAANRLIDKEAVVWPIFHFSMGFWASEKLNLTRYSVHWPLSELQWIGSN